METSGFNTQLPVDPYGRFNDDPCAGRHGGNIDSAIAWEKVRSHVREIHEKILQMYHASPTPLAPKEICELWGVHPSDISGRFTELKEIGVLRATAQKYNGSRRLELTERWLESVLSHDLRESETSATPKPPKKSRAEIRMIFPDEVTEFLKTGPDIIGLTHWINQQMRERVSR